MPEQEAIRLTEALKIADTITRRFISRAPSSVDSGAISSGAYLGALEALRRFDPEKGVAFPAWVRTYVSYGIKLELRSLDHLSRRNREQLTDRVNAGEEIMEMMKPPISLQERVGEEEEEFLEDRIPDPSISVEKAVVGKLHEEWLFHIVDQLPAVEKQVLILKYWQSATPIEMARALGLTKRQVAQIETRAETRLRRLLWEEGDHGLIC